MLRQNEVSSVDWPEGKGEGHLSTNFKFQKKRNMNWLCKKNCISLETNHQVCVWVTKEKHLIISQLKLHQRVVAVKIMALLTMLQWCLAWQHGCCCQVSDIPRFILFVVFSYLFALIIMHLILFNSIKCLNPIRSEFDESKEGFPMTDIHDPVLVEVPDADPVALLEVEEAWRVTHHLHLHAPVLLTLDGHVVIHQHWETLVLVLVLVSHLKIHIQLSKLILSLIQI